MKNFIKIAGVIAMVAVIGLSFIGCFGSGGGSSGNSGTSGGGSGRASVAPASDFKYELTADSKGVALLGYIGSGGNIIIPTEIEGLPIVEVRIFFENVTSAVIPDYYLPLFQNSDYPVAFDETLESITFPKGIKYIPAEFFMGNKGLKSFTIPDTVTEIHYGAFAYSGLTSIVIPEGVTIIEGNVFESCRDLKSVTLPESIREIRADAFADCSNLETINLPSHQIEIYSAGTYSPAFKGCTKLSLATQQALRNAGYTGTFN